MVIDVADMDAVYLTFDEPKKEEFWVEIQNMVPWAVRVDGVKGSDAAHKAAAEASTTDWFVLIDGDHMPEPEFFNQQFEEPDVPSSFRWKARNAVNGLMYGNGGISIWHKDFVMNMRTHENTDGKDENNVEFCFDPNYHAMWNVYGTTYPNQSEYHAWRAGFREGVKMCLNKGVKPSLEEFEMMVHNKNLDNLLVWMNVGRDVTFGRWAMYGARHGVYRTMIEGWDHTQVQDFEYLEMMWNQEVAASNLLFDDNYKELSKVLNKRLGLPIIDYTEEQSKFFKHFYANTHQQLDFMSKEINVIRQREGW